jgi:hypothetical protein
MPLSCGIEAQHEANTKMPDKPPPMFITYAHSDFKWLSRLQDHLEPALKHRGTYAWDDCRIEAGARWYESIQKALRSARLGVVLVSTAWLKSAFIGAEEWPVLEKAAEEGKLKILWILVETCLFDQHPIHKYQALGRRADGTLAEPLDEMPEKEQSGAIVKLCKQILTILDELPAPTPAPEPLLPPENLQATRVTTNTITLGWDPSRSSTPHDYVIASRSEHNDRFHEVARSANTSYTVAELSPGTEYEFHVASRDATGRTSQPSASVRVRSQASPPPPQQPVPPATVPPQREARLDVVRDYELSMEGIGPCVSDQYGTLWVANEQKASVFRIESERTLAVWSLPRCRWKGYLPEIWQNSLVYSDWSGSLYQTGWTGKQPRVVHRIYEAKADDLPIHRLAARPEGPLVIATWNGRVRIWNSTPDAPPTLGRDPFCVLRDLPLHLMVLKGGGLAVADQGDYLRWFDPAGRELWSWKAPGPIHEAWLHEAAGQTAVVAQIGHNRLVKVKLLPGEQTPEDVRLNTPIRVLSRRRGPDEYAVIAREGGRIDWLSTAGFGVLKGAQLQVPFTVRELVPVYDPHQPGTLLAVGLTTEGKVFSIQGREHTVYAQPTAARRLAVDHTGRFIYILVGDHLIAARTPGFTQTQCKVGLGQVDGKLVVNESRLIRVTLRNDGLIAIHRVKAELTGQRNIDTATFDQPINAVYKGQTFEIDFTVVAHQAGEFKLTLKLTLAERSGETNTQEIVFPIRSERV